MSSKMAFPPGATRLPTILLQRVEQDPALREIMNPVDLIRFERGSSVKTFVTSSVSGNEVTITESEMVSHVTEEVVQEAMTIAEIKSEPKI